MESIMKSDIFFFVTTICVFVVTALLLMILSNILFIVKRVRKHAELFSDEMDALLNDLSDLRLTLRENQFGLKPIFETIKKKAEMFSGKSRSGKRAKAKGEKSEENKNT